jgi:hypothetical protein
LAQKLREVHLTLHVWDKRDLGETKGRLKELQSDLDRVLSVPLSNEAKTTQQKIQLEIENIHEQDEIKWIQRSKDNWMKGGDRNSSFFYSFSTARKKRNFVKKLKDENGNWTEGWDYLIFLAI